MNEKNRFVSVNDSAILYGIAILLMVFHHLFCVPQRLGYDYVSVLGGYVIESRISYIGKMCVAIYAFISGYAFSVNKNQHKSVFNCFIDNARISIIRMLKLYSKFWMVCVVFLPIGFVFFGLSFNIREFAKGIFLGKAYNYEWWYVEQYLKFILLFPIIETTMNIIENTKDKTRRVIIAVPLIITMIGIIMSRYFRSTCTYVFIIALLIGRYNVFEYANKRIKMSIIMDIIGILLIIVTRYIVVTSPYTDKCDILAVPVFVYLSVDVIHRVSKRNILNRLFACFGKYSTFIWLIHTFWIYYYFQNVILMPRYSILIYAWTLLICLLNAWILDVIYNKLKMGMFIKKVTRNW